LSVFKAKQLIKRVLGGSFKQNVLKNIRVSDKHLILTYHRVSEEMPGRYADSALWVTSGALDMHLRQLQKVFDVVPLSTLLAFPKSDRGLCSITFDDGWIDTYEVAFPLLKKYGVPATVFVPTDLIGKADGFWFENLAVLAGQVDENGKESQFVRYFNRLVPAWHPKALNEESMSGLVNHLKHFPADILAGLVGEAYEALHLARAGRKVTIGWEEIAEMGKYNISFAPHGSNHFILPTLSTDLKRQEIDLPLAVFRERGIPAEPVFSYPNGDWDHESINYLAESGYKGAVTTRLGCNTSRTHPYLLNRIDLHEHISNTPGLFWFRILQAVIARNRTVCGH
jgi:peptidoglycan/xylan/chitin deacetylase (PgdA/CDA1 family)